MEDDDQEELQETDLETDELLELVDEDEMEMDMDEMIDEVMEDLDNESQPE